MKTKKTIRKLKSPVARRQARFSRTLHSMRRQIDTLTEEVEGEYRQSLVNARLFKESMMKQQTALESALAVKEELFPEEAPEASNPSGEEAADDNLA